VRAGLVAVITGTEWSACGRPCRPPCPTGPPIRGEPYMSRPDILEDELHGPRLEVFRLYRTADAHMPGAGNADAGNVCPKKHAIGRRRHDFAGKGDDDASRSAQRDRAAHVGHQVELRRGGECISFSVLNAVLFVTHSPAMPAAGETPFVTSMS
jgi:hypothetical protein